jgi:tetratricopeptide (TPR) repeat protein
LLDRSLVHYDDETERYNLHDLMRPVAREAFAYEDDHAEHSESGERIRKAERLFARHYCDVLDRTNDLYLKGGNDPLLGLALFGEEEENIRQGWAWASQHRLDERFAVEPCRDYPGRGVYIISLRLSALEQIVWLETSIDACRALGNRRGEGNALGNLGNAYTALGDARKAIEYYEQALVVSRALSNRRGEGAALGNLGLAHAALGDPRKAIEHHEQHLVIARALGDRRGERAALGNLGLVHAVLGDTGKAIEHLQRQLAIARALGDLRGEGNGLGSMGLAHAALGDSDKAIE